MAFGKQGGIVKPSGNTVVTGKKNGGGTGPSGGSTAVGKTPTPVGANTKKIH